MASHHSFLSNSPAQASQRNSPHQWVAWEVPCSPQAQPITTDKQFGVLLAAGRGRRQISRLRGKACKSGSSSIARNPTLALTPSIWCSHYFGQGTHRRRGDALVSIARHRRPARSRVARPRRRFLASTVSSAYTMVSYRCLSTISILP